MTNKTNLKINISKFKAQKHTFHIVRPSPWPFLTSVSLLNLAIYTVLIFHEFKTSKLYLFISLLYFVLIIGMWFRDVVIESHQGMHTLKVQRNFRYGMLVVLASETMFFFGFFWCYFYMSLSPSIWIGCTWPPVGIEPINPMHLPLFNTILLVSSGVCAVYSHRSIMRIDGRAGVSQGLLSAIVLGLAFTSCQILEYRQAPFSINDGIYGSIFYVSTGFHGLHVIIGTIALVVCYIRHQYYHFLIDHHVGLELSFWYWHFVDVTWILLYVVMYWGGCDLTVGAPFDYMEQIDIVEKGLGDLYELLLDEEAILKAPLEFYLRKIDAAEEALIELYDLLIDDETD